MSKSVKKTLVIIFGIISIALIVRTIIRSYTKQHSPEQTVTHTTEKANFTVFYNRPYKKKRKIFGELVPYGQVWRTGANEATTFTTDIDIMVDGSILKSGTYSLWTIPNKNSWKIIFNGEDYDWGVSMIDGTPSRDPEYDVLTLEVPVQPLLNVVEQFSIYFQDASDFTIMYLAWDQTAVAVPLKIITTESFGS